MRRPKHAPVISNLLYKKVAMKTSLLASLLVIVAVSASNVEQHGTTFRSFKLKHGKSYNSRTEEARRFAIFRDNLREIEEHNALYEQGLVPYKKGINKFTDMTPEEFRSTLNLRRKPVLQNTTPYVKTGGGSIPESVDWRTSGHVTPVGDQGACGSCWAFSIAGSTEAAYYRKYGELATLSKQQLLDCTNSVNYGCYGGYLDPTFYYVQEFGLQSEESYPYLGRNYNCSYNESEAIAKINIFVTLSYRENDLLEVVAKIGPVSAGLDGFFLMSYESGIFTDDYCSDEKLNHAILIVGYGTENGTDYWLVKNSWGADWGENGYFRLLRGSNRCGIAVDNVFPMIL